MTTHATLDFTTTRSGFARVTLYDAQGRVVRTLLDEAMLPAGRHPLRIDAHGGGRRLAAGMYFYRIHAAEGLLGGRFVFLD
jgi:hypothetical protein